MSAPQASTVADHDVAAITPEWLFAQGVLEPGGAVRWDTPLPEAGPGVYIVTIANPPEAKQRVVYIGRARSLRRRLRQFYRHRYGAAAPHRGGQDVLRLDGQKTVHWARADAYADAERAMLEAFRAQAGAWPYGNRIRSARIAPDPG